jgi:hypothetical protein
MKKALIYSFENVNLNIVLILKVTNSYISSKQVYLHRYSFLSKILADYIIDLIQ